jgi:RHS repeat-associated protein
VGWSVDGLSTIDRCAHKYSSDGYRRQISLDANDSFCLDGQRLVSVGGSSSSGSIEYRTEVETFAKILAEVSEEQPTSFTVYTKDGRILQYGSTSDSRGADAQGTLRIWALNRIEDRFGNFASIKYRAGGAPVAWMIPASNSATELLPDAISYTGHGSQEGDRGVRFEYADTRADTLQGFMPGGGFLSRTKRLDTIRISSGGATVRRYELYYEVAQNQTSRLTSLKECAGDGSPCKAPSTFHYFDDLGFFPGADAQTSPETGAFVPWSTPLATFQGQDRLAVMTQTGTETVSQPIPGEVQLAASLIFAESPFVGAALHAVNVLGAQASVSPISRAATYDFVQHTSTGGWPCGLAVGVDAGALAYQNIWRSATSGEDHVFYNCSQQPYAPKPSWMVDIDGDGIQDKLWCSYELPGGDTVNYRLSHRAAYGVPPWDATTREGTIPFGLTSSAASPTLCNTSQTASFTFDVDGDGTGNLVYWQPDPLSSAGQWRAVAYDPVSGPHFVNLGVDGDRVAFPVLRNYNFVIDANGDGLKDILSLLSPDHSPAEHPVPVLWLNDGKHLRRTTLEAGNSAATAPYYPGHVIDYDHDGIEDIIHPNDSLKDHVEGIGAPPSWMLRRIRDGKLTIEPLGTNLLTYPGTLGDFTGDGNADVALTSPGSNRILVVAGAGRRHGLLKLVTDGLGRSVEVKYDVTNPEGVATYRSDVVTYNDGVDCVWPTSCLPSVDHALVSSYVRQYLTDRATGGTTIAGSASFSYQNARADLGGAGWLGFGLRTITEHDAGGAFLKKTEVRGRRPVNSVYEAPFPERYVRVLDALPAQVVETYPHADSAPAHGASSVPSDDHLVVWSTFDWHQQLSDKGIPFAVLGNKRVVTQEFYEETPVNLFERVELQQVDQFGNVYDVLATEQDFVTEFTGAQGQPVPGSQTMEHVARVFQPTTSDVDAWLIGRPDSETVDSQARCAAGVTCTPATKTRHATFHYEPGTTLLREVTREPGDPHLEQTTQYIPDALGNIESVTVSAPGGHLRETVIGYDDRRLFPVSLTNRKGQVTQVRYDDRFGKLTLSVDPNGIDESFAFDDFGNLRRHHRPEGDSEVDYEVASFHLGPVWSTPMPIPAVLRRTARRVGGETVIEELNGLGQVVQRTTSGLLGSSVMEEFTYDARGRLYRATRPHLLDNYLQGFVEYGYDALDRMISQKFPDGSIAKSTYGNVAKLAFDFAGKRVPGAMSVAEMTDPNGHSTLIQSDRRGQPLRVTDALDQSTNYVHGPFGTVLSIIAPDGSVISHDYDAYNRLTAATDAAWGGTYASVYDGLDEVETGYDPALRATTVTYDEIGRVSEVNDADGLTEFIYDGDGTRPNEIGRLIETVSSSGQRTRYGYESPGSTFNRGLPTTVTRNLTAPAGGGLLELTTAQHYDEFGRVSQIDYPAPSANPLSVTYEFDPAGHIFKARNSNTPGTVYWELLEADQGVRVHKERLGTDRLTQKDYWPLTGRIKKIETKRVGSTIQSLEYGYDLTGNLTTRLNSVDQTSETFGYDAIDRLVSSVNASGATTGAWAYAPLKGRLSSQAGVGAYTYRETGRDWIQSAGPYEYEPDSLGNIRTRGNVNDPSGTQYIDYTTFGLPSHVRIGDGPSAPTSDFRYDAYGDRVIKQNGARVTYYAGDFYQAVVNGGSVEHRFTIYAGGRAVAQILADDGVEGGDALSYLHDDVLGSIQTVSGATNRSQNFAPFGASSGPTLGEPLGFTGQEHDPELGLVNMRGRLYDPVLGQFLSPDPVIQQPYGQGLNRYAYVLNNPLGYTDPSGFTPEDVGETLTAAFVFGGRAAAVGAAVYGFGWASGPTQAAPSAAAAAMGAPTGAVAGAPGGASFSDLTSAAGGLGLLANVAAGVSDMVSAGNGVHRVLPPTAGSHAASSGGIGSPSFGRTSQNPISPRTTTGASVQEAQYRSNALGQCNCETERRPWAPPPAPPTAGNPYAPLGKWVARQWERSSLRKDWEWLKVHVGGETPEPPVSPALSPGDVVGKTPAEIDEYARGAGLLPRGPDPASGRGAYVDPVTGEQRVLVHPGDSPHAHVNDATGARLGPSGQRVAPESPEAHLPIKWP